MILSLRKTGFFTFALLCLTLSTLFANPVNFSHVNNVDESFNVTMNFSDATSSTLLLPANFTTNYSTSKTISGVTVNGEYVASGTSVDVTLYSLTEITVDFTGGEVIYDTIDDDGQP